MDSQPRPRLLIVAVVMVIVGAIASVALIFPPLQDLSTPWAVVLYVLAMGAPIGLLLGVVYALLSGRRAR